MAESHPIFPLPEMQLVEDALVAEAKLLGSALTLEMKLLEGALVASTQPSPFKPKNVKLPDGSKLAANFCRIMTHSQHLVQEFIRRQLAGEHFVKHHAERVEVGTVVDTGSIAALLRGHVGWGAGVLSVRAHQRGDPEVGDLDPALAV